MELIQALEDLLWWVQDGLDNAELTNRQYQRTVNCKNRVLQHIAELKKEPTNQQEQVIKCPVDKSSELEFKDEWENNHKWCENCDMFYPDCNCDIY